ENICELPSKANQHYRRWHTSSALQEQRSDQRRRTGRQANLVCRPKRAGTTRVSDRIPRIRRLHLPRQKQSPHLLDLARRGAEARLRELAVEARNLFQMFPNLRDAVDRDELPVKFLLARGAGRPAPKARTGQAASVQPSAPARRRRRRMSAA